jgi:hypothetical protein
LYRFISFSIFLSTALPFRLESGGIISTLTVGGDNAHLGYRPFAVVSTMQDLKPTKILTRFSVSILPNFLLRS